MAVLSLLHAGPARATRRRPRPRPDPATRSCSPAAAASAPSRSGRCSRCATPASSPTSTSGAASARSTRPSWPAATTPDRVDELAALWRSLGSRDIFPGGRASVAGAVVRTVMHRGDHLYEPHALRVAGPALGARARPRAHRGAAARSSPPTCTPARRSGTPAAPPRTSSPPAPPCPGCSRRSSSAAPCTSTAGWSRPVPTARAVELGATRVWVLDVTGGTVGRMDSRMTALDVLLRSFAVSRAQLCREVPRAARHPGAADAGAGPGHATSCATSPAPRS